MSTKDQKDLRFEFELVFRSDAADILAAREKARIMHHGHDIHAAGDEVEITGKCWAASSPRCIIVNHKIP